MKKKQGIGILVIVLLLCCSIGIGLWIAKGTVQQGNTNASDSGIRFWVAAATEKIMQDVSSDEYADVVREENLIVSAVRNEYENAQLIMTAEKDIDSYTAEVTDLKAKKGDAVISSDNITVYNQKYVEVLKRVNTYYPLPAGMYPDGLVPIESAVNCGENTIKKGENQGLWLTFYIPKDAEAGEYTGSITVTYGEEEHTTPISLTVYDYTLADETHLRTAFSIAWPFANGELDSTYAMYKKYSDVMLDYRLSSDLYRGVDTSSEEGFEELIEYANKPLKPVIYLPYGSSTYDGILSFDYAMMKETILKFVKRSISDGNNYIPQLMVYFGTLIDEPNPEDPAKTEQVKYVCNAWNTLLDEIATELKRDSAFMANGALAKEIIEEVKYIEHVIAGYKHGDHEEAFGDVDATWCPTNNYFEGGRDFYETQHERWWYTMLVPYAPYSTYHIDDILLSSRMLSWMQYDFGVVGNLYWAVNNYISIDDTALEDYYGLMSSSLTPGDGFLVYPGAKYDVDGPIPTIRLMSIRDGIEEYDMMYDLGEKYSEIGKVVEEASDFKTVFQSYTQYLYDGTKSTATTDVFEIVRETLLEMCEMSTENAYLVGYRGEGDKMTYSILAKDGISVKAGKAGVERTKTYTVGDIAYGYYSAEVADEKVKVVTSDKEYKVNLKFVGSAYSVKAEELAAEDFTFVNGGSASKDTYNDKEVYKLSLPQTDVDKTQIVRFANSELFALLNDSANVLTLEVYAEESVSLKLNVKYKNKATMYEMVSVTLEPGINKIELKNLFAVDWDGLGNVEYVAFYFGEKGDSARNIYFGDIYLTTMKMGGE